MFPIVHYFTNLQVYGEVTPLMALGGLFPDLASGAGMERNDAHQMGAAFYRWCEREAPDFLPLARGIISHGVQPFGVDYYADEQWPGCERGWCFDQGRPWMERIAAVTRLPESLWWWKSHNFVEMTYELLTIEAHPAIGDNIVAAVSDAVLTRQAALILSRYTGREEHLIDGMFRKAPEIFALTEVSAQAMAEHQDTAFRRRHNVYDADVGGMTALMEEMQEKLRDGYGYYMPRANSLVGEMLSNY